MRFLLVGVLAALWVSTCQSLAHATDSFSRYSVAFVPRNQNILSRRHLSILRGGATLADDDEEEESEEEEADENKEESESEEEEEDFDAALTAAAMKATAKSGAKKSAATKKAVSAKLSKTAVKKKKKSKKNILAMLHVPYIIRACLNPVTLISMTKGFWGSLFNLDYLEPDSSQELRSALEEKAKRSGGSTGGAKGKRKFKPGQAKTLSDLPQLST